MRVLQSVLTLAVFDAGVHGNGYAVSVANARTLLAPHRNLRWLMYWLDALPLSLHSCCIPAEPLEWLGDTQGAKREQQHNSRSLARKAGSPVQLDLPLAHLLIVVKGVHDGRLDGREGSNRVTAGATGRHSKVKQNPMDSFLNPRTPPEYIA